MRNYTTQMDAARQGIITPEMKAVAAKEYRTEEEIRDLVAKGQVAICANKLHTCIDPNGVGSMLRTKINVNLGVSRDCKDYDIEMQKVMDNILAFWGIADDSIDSEHARNMIKAGKRIGIDYAEEAADYLWRFYVEQLER